MKEASSQMNPVTTDSKEESKRNANTPAFTWWILYMKKDFSIMPKRIVFSLDYLRGLLKRMAPQASFLKKIAGCLLGT
jgi:hypothetical protein